LSSNRNHCGIEYFFKDTFWNRRCTIELNRLWKNRLILCSVDRASRYNLCK